MSELHEYAYEDGRWGDLLTSVDGIDLEYDGSGNPTLYANGTELLWNMEWQNGRQLSRATTERDSTTEDVLDFAYDANGIRTSKTVTRNTYRPVQTYKVTFVADGKTVKTMNVTEGYTLKDSDYPAVPEKAGYTGAWQRYPSPVKSNVTVSATYTKITTYYTVTFVADGFTIKTMQVYSGYKLKDSDYPSVPEKLRYEGTWQKYTAAITSNVTVQATYRKMLPLLVRFYADETLVKTMQVDYGYRLNDLDYPDVPPKTGFTGSWRKYTQRITSDQIIRANYTPIGIIDPIQPSAVDSEPTEEPWEPIEPNAAPAEEPVAAEPGLSESDWTLASTETVTHEYLTQNGKVARETIRQDVGGTVLSTKTLHFFYDDSGRPFAFNYSVDGGIASTYYYILNLQGDVVQIIDEGGVLQAEYVYSPWGEVISAEGDLAEINPLRYRGYYYDSETGFYYLRSRYYDPENHRFINADTYASTDSGDAIACNMFAYCNNNPVVFLDSTGMYSISAVTTLVSTDNDIATYTTTITSDSRYELLGFISLGSIENYKFTYVVSNTGVITFDNTQEDAKYLAKRNGGDVRLMLAAEMMRVAKEQVPGALEGRTVFGIQSELALHYTAYVLHIKRSSSTKADIGSSKPGAIGYDSNADYFEHPFKHIKDIVNMLL